MFKTNRRRGFRRFPLSSGKKPVKTLKSASSKLRTENVQTKAAMLFSARPPKNTSAPFNDVHCFPGTCHEIDLFFSSYFCRTYLFFFFSHFLVHACQHRYHAAGSDSPVVFWSMPGLRMFRFGIKHFALGSPRFTSIFRRTVSRHASRVDAKSELEILF